MISLVKVIIEHFSKLLGKIGELRYGNILPAPKLSSSYRVLKYLSSCVLLLKKLVTYSHILFRVSIDPRVKSEGDRKERVSEGDERRKSVPEGDRKENVPEGDRKESVFEGGGRWKNVPEGDNLYKVMPRFGTNHPGIFELDEKLNNRKIPGIFCDAKNRDDFNLGMTVLKIGSFLDVFWRKRGMTLLVGVFSLFLLFPNVSNSAVYFLPDAQSDEIFSSSPIASIDSVRCEELGYTYYSSGACPAYHNQDTCVFSDKYLKCDATGWCRDNAYTITSCSSPKVVNTQCPNGLSLYKSCVCPGTYKYACTGTGYSSGSSTVCESKYTSCNCSTNYVWSGSACVCDSSFKYSCSGTGYSSGSGASCGGKYKSCNCSTYYSWNGSACAHTHSYVCPSGYSTSSSGMISPKSTSKVCQLSGCSSTSGTCYKEGHIHSYSCPSGSYTSSSSCSYGTSGTTSKKCSCGATSGTCYKCATHSHSYSCPSGSYSSSSSCSYGTSGTTSKVCSCGATSSGTCYYCAANPCDDNPCASGCYKDLSCQYGCASWNSCDGCSRCKSAPSSSSDPNCPQIVCEGSIIGGKYSDGVCSKNCEILKCNNKCVCESVNGGTLIDGYCTEYCVGMCADVSIEGGGGWG